MTLTHEDINAIITAIEPQFEKLANELDEFRHTCNKRFTAIELRLDGIEYKLGQIAVFIPYENAYIIPPIKKPSS